VVGQIALEPGEQEFLAFEMWIPCAAIFGIPVAKPIRAEEVRAPLSVPGLQGAKQAVVEMGRPLTSA